MIVDKEAELIENDQINTFIEKKLLKTYSYFSYTMNKFYLYNERNDSFYWYDIFKVSNTF